MRRIALGMLTTAGLLVGLLLIVSLVLDNPESNHLDLAVPNRVAYWTHAGLGAGLNAAGLDPTAAAFQWIKAASHARTPTQIARAGRGIARARQESRDRGALDDILCEVEAGAAPWVQQAEQQSGLRCRD